MNRLALIVALSLAAAPRALGQQPAAPETSTQIIRLWPEGVPGAKPNGGEERNVANRVSNVHEPTLAFFPAPRDTANGTVVIVCPGGGYARLAVDKEGSDIAKMLNGLGVSAFVLKYRLLEYGHPGPLQDVLRAIRTVRSRATEFGVLPTRIGVMGFSAGGHVAASAATLFDAPEGRTGAAIDDVSARPDFVVLIYPVITLQPPYAHAGSRQNLLGATPDPALVQRLSVETQVSSNTPPAFLAHTGEDTTVPIENSILFYQALRRAGVSAEMHLYQKGAHGFGMAPGNGPTSEWPRRLEDWLRFQGLLAR